ncbi:MAG: TrbC/VirB2 family protein [Hydrogenophaga sp.]|uniref:TrbC/VirB2 family protein n=1 Tax=Hydrogenophaga sp. TaxID=1904254 RepID=UPI0025C43D28|nr:TrbC/VirB2 family protein [Hydrogenophaga sp.]MBT9552229.1 TrbC/VirB2 family protein [Hydrogenophaga sp.]
MNKSTLKISNIEYQTIVVMALVFAVSAMMPTTSYADFGEACTKVTGFFSNFETILRVASISIVTIAIVFAGYQIAFAHKRLSDVAPILVGGLLIGGAATIAGWFVGDWVLNAGSAATC